MSVSEGVLMGQTGMSRVSLFACLLGFTGCADEPGEAGALTDAQKGGGECSAPLSGKSWDEQAETWVAWRVAPICDADGKRVRDPLHPRVFEILAGGYDTNGDGVPDGNVRFSDDPEDGQAEVAQAWNPLLETHDPKAMERLVRERGTAMQGGGDPRVVWTSVDMEFIGTHSLDSAVQSAERTLCGSGEAGPDLSGSQQGIGEMIEPWEFVWLETYSVRTVPDITAGGYPDYWEVERQQKLRHDWSATVDASGTYFHWTTGGPGLWADYGLSDVDLEYGYGGVGEGEPVLLCHATMVRWEDLTNLDTYPDLTEKKRNGEATGGYVWKVKSRLRDEDTHEVSYWTRTDSIRFRVP